jgi:hypothetical protein
VFQDGKEPWFKVYFHLMALGRQNARAEAYAALERLGLEESWDAVESRLHGADELLFLSFDLVPEDIGRVKLYIRHAEATPATLTLAAQTPESDNSGGVHAFVEELTGRDNPVIHRGALTSLQLKRGSRMPVHASTHVRLYPHCASSDAVLFTRLQRALQRLEVPAEPYEKAVTALATRGLDEEGLHGWASVQWAQQRPSVTVYLSPRLYFPQYGPIALDPARMWPSPLAPQHLDERQPACASP